MTAADFGLIAALLAGTVLLATLLAWRGGDERRDLALMGGSGLALAATSAALLIG
jgi:hypothetical protein